MNDITFLLLVCFLQFCGKRKGYETATRHASWRAWTLKIGKARYVILYLNSLYVFTELPRIVCASISSKTPHCLKILQDNKKSLSAGDALYLSAFHRSILRVADDIFSHLLVWYVYICFIFIIIVKEEKINRK